MSFYCINQIFKSVVQAYPIQNSNPKGQIDCLSLFSNMLTIIYLGLLHVRKYSCQTKCTLSIFNTLNFFCILIKPNPQMTLNNGIIDITVTSSQPILGF